jgi:hypothetical protein
MCGSELHQNKEERHEAMASTATGKLKSNLRLEGMSSMSA